MRHPAVLAAVFVLFMNQPALSQENVKSSKKGPLVTFVELGSVKCIPCRQMQPVMKAIEEKFGEQVKVVFYDVWKEDQKHFAQKYGIRLIPTQVFLDESGKEILRHEGFFPEHEIAAFLQGKGLKPRQGSASAWRLIFWISLPCMFMVCSSGSRPWPANGYLRMGWPLTTVSRSHSALQQAL